MKNTVTFTMKITGRLKNINAVLPSILVNDYDQKKLPIKFSIANADQSSYFNKHDDDNKLISAYFDGSYKNTSDYDYDKQLFSDLSKTNNLVIELYSTDICENSENHLMFIFGTKECDEYKDWELVSEDCVDEWNEENPKNKITADSQCDSDGNYSMGGFVQDFKDVNDLFEHTI